MGNPDWRYLGVLAIGPSLLAGVYIGRRLAPVPPPVVTRDRQEERTVTVQAKAETQETRVADVSVGRDVTRWRTRVVTVTPDGARREEETTTERGQEQRQEKTQEQRATKQEASMQAREVIRERVEVPAAPPRWLAAGAVAPSLTGVSGGTVTAGVRVAGPLWLIGTAGRLGGEWTATVGVGATW